MESQGYLLIKDTGTGTGTAGWEADNKPGVGNNGCHQQRTIPHTKSTRGTMSGHAEIPNRQLPHCTTEIEQ